MKEEGGNNATLKGQKRKGHIKRQDIKRNAKSQGWDGG